MKTRLPLRAGFSLVEVLVVMALLGFLMSYATITLWAMVRIQQADARHYHNLIRHNTLADRFRDDVGNAAAAPEALGILRVNPQCLILRRADGVNVVYSIGDNGLERLELNGDFEPTAVLNVYELHEGQHIEFAADNAGRLLTLRITDVGEFHQKPAVEIMAALGGDVR